MDEWITYLKLLCDQGPVSWSWSSDGLQRGFRGQDGDADQRRVGWGVGGLGGAGGGIKTKRSGLQWEGWDRAGDLKHQLPQVRPCCGSCCSPVCSTGEDMLRLGREVRETAFMSLALPERLWIFCKNCTDKWVKVLFKKLALPSLYMTLYLCHFIVIMRPCVREQMSSDKDLKWLLKTLDIVEKKGNFHDF